MVLLYNSIYTTNILIAAFYFAAITLLCVLILVFIVTYLRSEYKAMSKENLLYSGISFVFLLIIGICRFFEVGFIV